MMPSAALMPPHAEPAPGLLSLWQFVPRFIKNPLTALPAPIYTERIVVRRGRFRTAWVAAPDLIEQVLLAEHEQLAKTRAERRALGHSLGDGLLTSSGASWRWQRRTVAPVFRHGELLALVPAMVEAAEQQTAQWLQHPSSGPRDIGPDMDRVTFNIICRTIFAGAVDEERAAIESGARDYLDHITWQAIAGILDLPKWIWHPGKSKMMRAAARSRATVHDILKRRRASGSTGSDIIGRLIEARDPETGAPMSDEQLVDNLLTFLGAGHETTAKALTWTLYLLARAPEWQSRVAEEVRTVAGNATLTAADLDRLPLTRQVVKEGMRLYPPAPIISRVNSKPLRLDGYELPSGTNLIFPIYAIHRHTKLWDQPMMFDPSRFTAEKEAKHARAQFMPFGFGPRICIGMSFAMMEAVLMLATFVRAFHFKWDGVHNPEPINRITLRPRGGMPLTLTART